MTPIGMFPQGTVTHLSPGRALPGGAALPHSANTPQNLCLGLGPAEKAGGRGVTSSTAASLLPGEAGLPPGVWGQSREEGTLCLCAGGTGAKPALEGSREGR